MLLSPYHIGLIYLSYDWFQIRHISIVKVELNNAAFLVIFIIRCSFTSRIQLINAPPSESLILSEAISQNTSHGVL